MLVTLTSAKGAPGVTTTALCLAAHAGAGALVVEVDPAGGDLECWTGPHGEAGLVGLATRMRPGLTETELRSHAVEVVSGITAVTAPTTEAAMSAVLSRAADRLGPVLAGVEVDVIGDLGRWLPSRSMTGLLAAADLVLVVCRPTLDSIQHARGLVAPGGPVDATAAAAAAVVVGGSHPYGPSEIAVALGLPVVGVVPWDPRGAVALVEHGDGRAWRRSALAAATGELAEGMRVLAGKTWTDA
jgi:MinD-like ATPase involved in chromosome partitioning or flagellar assembly